MISPVIFFAVVIGVIYALQYFTQAYIVPQPQTDQLGDPQGSLLFYPLWMYQQACQGSRWATRGDGLGPVPGDADLRR